MFTVERIKQILHLSVKLNQIKSTFYFM